MDSSFHMHEVTVIKLGDIQEMEGRHGEPFYTRKIRVLSNAWGEREHELELVLYSDIADHLMVRNADSGSAIT